MYSTFLNPECKIPRGATRKHGITNRDVESEPKFSEVADEIRDFIGALPIVGHNISFDKKFMNAEFKRAGIKTLHRNKSYCTMWRFREEFPGLKSSLDAVSEFLELEGRESKTHDALEDTYITFQIASDFYAHDSGIEPVKQSPPRKLNKTQQKEKKGNPLFLIVVFVALLILALILEQ